MSGERYWIRTPNGDIPLPASLRPAQLQMTGSGGNYVRARGYRKQFNLADRLADPGPLILSGVVDFEDIGVATEAALSAWLRTLQQHFRVATHYSREMRRWDELDGASLLAVPLDDDSSQAVLTVTLLPNEVPDPDDINPYFF